MNNSAPYGIEIKHRLRSTEVILEIFDGPLSTSVLPHVYGVLQHELPHIFASTCFNDDGIPFRKEVLCTETGHLFEHILLEYLSSEKLSCGHSMATYKGETYWDWKKEVRGRFHITVSTGSEEIELFHKALDKCLSLFERIMWRHTFVSDPNGQVGADKQITNSRTGLAY